MSTALPDPPGTTTTIARTIGDLLAALRNRIYRNRPPGPSRDRVDRYLETGAIHPREPRTPTPGAGRVERLGPPKPRSDD